MSHINSKQYVASFAMLLDIKLSAFNFYKYRNNEADAMMSNGL
jgi:hypothetical protein